MPAFHFIKAPTPAPRWSFFFLPSARVKCKKRWSISVATTLPCLQMARSLSSLKTVVWSPILQLFQLRRKRKKKKSCICLGELITLYFQCSWENRERGGCGYSRASWGWAYILLAYILQPIFGNAEYCSLEYMIFRWCAPYVAICTTQLRLLLVW